MAVHPTKSFFSCVAAAITIVGAATAQLSGTVSEDDLTFFAQNSYARFGGTSTPGFDDRLYRAITGSKGAHSAAEIINVFARKLNVDEVTAESYARLLIASLRHAEACDRGEGPCTLAEDPELEVMLRLIALAEPTGELLVSAGEMVGADVIAIASEHRQAETILMGYYRHDRRFIHLAALLTQPRPSLQALRAAVGDTFPEFRSADLLALLDSVVQRTAESPDMADEHASAVTAFVYQLAEHGLSAEALAAYDSLSINERTALQDSSSATFSADEGQGIAHSRFFSFSVDLAALLINAERTDEAVEIVAALKHLEPELSGGEQRTIVLLDELLQQKLADEDVFDAFVFGYSDGEERPAWAEDVYDHSGMIGLLAQASRGAPALRRATARYLRERDRDDMAAYLLAQSPHYAYSHPKTLAPSAVAAMGAGFTTLIDHYAELIDAAEHDAANRAVGPSLTGRFLEDRPITFVERELPPALQDASPVKNDAPDLSAINISPHQIVRAEQADDGWVVIYLSHALDPVGEMSGGGYWAVRSPDGERWEEPVYLGIQQFFPYDIARTSALPIVDGDRLRLEVSVREIDRASITFPPIGLRASRAEDGLYLDFDWAALTADTDRDGLTDVAEHRMGLSAYSRDTDGDGVEDGLDSLPTVAFVPSPEGYELGLELIETLYGYERGALIVGAPRTDAEDQAPPSIEDMLTAAMGQPQTAIDPASTLFLEGDPQLFASLRLPFRLIIQTRVEVERLSSEYGVFYAAGIRWMFEDARSGRRFIIWDASWVGGSFILQKTPEGYEKVVVSQWIT